MLVFRHLKQVIGDMQTLIIVEVCGVVLPKSILTLEWCFVYNYELASCPHNIIRLSTRMSGTGNMSRKVLTNTLQMVASK